jgi:hypothetical protein
LPTGKIDGFQREHAENAGAVPLNSFLPREMPQWPRELQSNTPSGVQRGTFCSEHMNLTATSIDFSTITNPLINMEWQVTEWVSVEETSDADAVNGTNTTNVSNAMNSTLTSINVTRHGVMDVNGLTSVPPVTPGSPGPLPDGYIRWRNAGQDSTGLPFDLLVTVSSPASHYSEFIDIAYSSPDYSGTGSQAVLTEYGYVCLGVGIRESYCWSGAALNAENASCVDGTPTTMHGAEFDLQLVEAGSTQLFTPFHRLAITFFDVDGDWDYRHVDNDAGKPAFWGAIFELNSVLGASTVKIDMTSSLEAGIFYPSEALYAIAASTAKVKTNFLHSPESPSIDSLPGIATFSISASRQAGTMPWPCAALR